MVSYKHAGLVLLFCVVCTLCQEDDLWAEVFSEPGGTGASVYTKDYIADLTLYLPGGLSVCGAGAWLLYESHNYGSASSGESQVFLGSGTCTDTNFNVTSIRQAGSPTVLDRPALTLYAYSQYRGIEFYITDDLPFLGAFSDQAYSAVVTGTEPWSVYTYDSYDGQATCLQPNTSVLAGTTTIDVGVFPTYHELGSAGGIRSVRKGCDF